MSDSVRPHRWQPTRLPRPWDSPGKNTRVGCHFLLQCMNVKSENEVAQSCPTLSSPMGCSLPGSSAMGFLSKSTGVGCHCLLIAVSPQENNLKFLSCKMRITMISVLLKGCCKHLALILACYTCPILDCQQFFWTNNE